MQWVIAALLVGCVFFTFQVVMDYVRYRSVIRPRLEQLESARRDLETRLDEAQTQLHQRRGKLEPLQKQVQELEQQRIDLENSIRQAQGNTQADVAVRLRRRDETGS